MQGRRGRRPQDDPPPAKNIAKPLPAVSIGTVESRAPVAPAAKRYDVAGDSTRPLRTRDPSPAHSGRGDGCAGDGWASLADAPLLCELLANVDPARYERAALRWLQRFIDERLPPLTEVALAASALAELRHGNRNAGVETLKRLLRSG
jgi:hypothetical protein